MDRIREYAAVGSLLGGSLAIFIAAMGWMFDLRGNLWTPLLAGLVLLPVGYKLWPYRD